MGHALHARLPSRRLVGPDVGRVLVALQHPSRLALLEPCVDGQLDERLGVADGPALRERRREQAVLQRLLPPGPAPGLRVLFSVDGASAGFPFAPPLPNLSCEAAGGEGLGDVFASQPFGPPLPFLNVQALDGNGVPAACGPFPSPGLGLIEPSPDDVSNLEMCPATFVYSGVGLTAPVFRLAIRIE